jgi:hypothetical protein
VPIASHPDPRPAAAIRHVATSSPSWTISLARAGVSGDGEESGHRTGTGTTARQAAEITELACDDGDRRGVGRDPGDRAGRAVTRSRAALVGPCVRAPVDCRLDNGHRRHGDASAAFGSSGRRSAPAGGVDGLPACCHRSRHQPARDRRGLSNPSCALGPSPRSHGDGGGRELQRPKPRIAPSARGGARPSTRPVPCRAPRRAATSPRRRGGR